MLENSEKGAWGLVINKPLSSIPLSSLIYKSRDATNKQKELYNVKIPVYWGGPVNESKILILHSEEYKNETTINFKNISISSDYNILFEIADNKGPKNKLVILGVSSWGDGQLEGEMERDHWILSDIDLDITFDNESDTKWNKAYKKSFIKI